MKTHNPLGKEVSYPTKYDPSLLFPIPRTKYRALVKNPCFVGFDLWNCFELSWLNNFGVPESAIMQISIPASSPAIVESKSLKLYLGSFAGKNFGNPADVKEAIQKDLTHILGTSEISVSLLSPSEWSKRCTIIEPPGICIDEDIKSSSVYEYTPALLSEGSKSINSEQIIFYSNNFRSLCPVTNQPDWATIVVAADGGNWNLESVGRYLISFRNHAGFHEHCCETIFSDLMEFCAPKNLSVQCFFTRRGGIDINPLRQSSRDFMPYQIDNFMRLSRQ